MSIKGYKWELLKTQEKYKISSLYFTKFRFFNKLMSDLSHHTRKTIQMRQQFARVELAPN